MKTVGRMVAIGLAVMALLALVGTAPAAEQTAPAERGPGWIGDVRVMPALAVRETGWATGLRVSFLWGEKTAPRRRAPDLAKASAGKVYREEAVARWSPGYGELIAAAGVGVGDVNAVVKTEETPRTLTWPGRVGAWSYTNRWWVGGGGLLAAIVGVGLETDWMRTMRPPLPPNGSWRTRSRRTRSWSCSRAAWAMSWRSGMRPAATAAPST